MTQSEKLEWWIILMVDCVTFLLQPKLNSKFKRMVGVGGAIIINCWRIANSLEQYIRLT